MFIRRGFGFFNNKKGKNNSHSSDEEVVRMKTLLYVYNELGKCN